MKKRNVLAILMLSVCLGGQVSAVKKEGLSTHFFAGGLGLSVGCAGLSLLALIVGWLEECDVVRCEALLKEYKLVLEQEDPVKIEKLEKRLNRWHNFGWRGGEKVLTKEDVERGFIWLEKRQKLNAATNKASLGVCAVLAATGLLAVAFGLISPSRAKGDDS